MPNCAYSPRPWGGQRVRQGNTSPANITTVVEMKSKPLPISPVCPMSNSSSLYTLFFSVIYNSVVRSHPKPIRSQSAALKTRLCIEPPLGLEFVLQKSVKEYVSKIRKNCLYMY